MYRCLRKDCNHSQLIEYQECLRCVGGHRYSFLPDSRVPVFTDIGSYNSEFTNPESVEFNDNNVEWLFSAFRANEPDVRRNLLSRLHPKPGQRVLITAAGTGKDLPVITELLGGNGTIFAQDISPQMLIACHERIHRAYGLSDMNIELSVSDAMDLPFFDGFFDSAFHFGGLNFYSNIKKGIAEMNRVVKIGGRVVIADKGIAPWLLETDYGKMIVANNPLAASSIPLSLLPHSARDVNISWILGYYCYVIDFTTSESLPDLDLDRHHIGRRGGSMRTRYYGQLEGVNPKLKDRIYVEAERRGMSRVDFLEQILKSALDD